MTKRLFFSVGEPSGDLHAANLIRAMHRLDTDVECRGFGGVRMAEAGFESDFDLTELAVMGIVEVLPKLREFFARADQAEEIFQRGEVDAVVLVDFPGFNWHIAKRAKKYGLPVYYYLPPQLWAWGGWRVHKLKRYVDRVFCNLPFEHDWLAKHGVAVDYVGHPFFDQVARHSLDPRFLQHWSCRNGTQVAVLPGSRDHEVHRLWPMQLEVIRRLNQQHPDVRFLVAAYKDAHALWCRQHLKSTGLQLPIEIFVGKTSEIIELADIALAKSGSVSLELMARGTPSVIVYRIGRSLHMLGRLLFRQRSFTLPNLIAGETLMPEFLSSGNPELAIEGIANEMNHWLNEPQQLLDNQRQLGQLAARFAQPGASDRTAELVLEYSSHPKQTSQNPSRLAA